MRIEKPAETEAPPHFFYALGHSEQELQRLSRQGKAFESFTRQVFNEAGISGGMRVLDIGSGSGDVAFLAADLVGLDGEVVGVDREPTAIRWANARAHSRGMRNVKFVQGDPAEMDFGCPFDAIVGRLVLMYYPNPVETIRNLSRHLRPGGLLVFQEIDVANCRSYPPAPIFDRAVAWIKAAFSATGARLEQGLELYPLFLAAGLPAPSLRLDSLIGGGSDCVAYDHIAGVVRSLLPAIEMLKIASASEIRISSLAQRIRDEVVAQEGVVLSPALIGAWSRKVHIEG